MRLYMVNKMSRERELLKRLVEITNDPIHVHCGGTRLANYDYLLKQIEEELAKPEPDAYKIKWPEYYSEGMGCGLEDRNITDRYEAMLYGWECALDAVSETLPEKI